MTGRAQQAHHGCEPGSLYARVFFPALPEVVQSPGYIFSIIYRSKSLGIAPCILGNLECHSRPPASLRSIRGDPSMAPGVCSGKRAHVHAQISLDIVVQLHSLVCLGVADCWMTMARYRSPSCEDTNQWCGVCMPTLSQLSPCFFQCGGMVANACRPCLCHSGW